MNGCIHTPKRISFVGSLPQIPGEPRSTSPTLVQMCTQLAHQLQGLGLCTRDPHASPCYFTGLQGSGNGIQKWQKIEGNGLNGKFSLFIILFFFLVSGIQHVLK